MSVEENKEIVRGYFAEVVDKFNIHLLGEYYTHDCIIHRPEVEKPIIGIEDFKTGLSKVIDSYSSIKTTIYEMFGSDDRISCRLSHLAVHRDNWKSRIGYHEVAGKTVGWSAIANFRIEGDKIAEEWVCRDELGMLIGLGVIRPSK